MYHKIDSPALTTTEVCCSSCIPLLLLSPFHIARYTYLLKYEERDIDDFIIKGDGIEVPETGDEKYVFSFNTYAYARSHTYTYTYTLNASNVLVI